MSTSFHFPKEFMFGVATAAAQVEGAWNEDGKSESIWDYQAHTFPERIANNATADIACDSYHRLDEDITALLTLGVHFYRFSIAWCRILPTGFPNVVNQPGIDYYNRLIDKLLANGIEPMVTLYHFDLPQKLQDLGGWTNSKMADYFVSYARICFEHFGDRVKWWITFNEPLQVTEFGYSVKFLAPYIELPGVGPYLAGHTLLLAHGRTYRMYSKEFKNRQNGRIGIVIEAPWAEPLDQNTDKDATERFLQMYFGWFAHPIFSKTGDYPLVMRHRVDSMSRLQGFHASRLPSFTSAEVDMLRGSADFLGLNHYTAFKISEHLSEDDLHLLSEESDRGCRRHFDPEWPTTGRPEFKIVPSGLRCLLNWIKDEYANPAVIITENGYCAPANESLHDSNRVDYLHAYVAAVLMAIAKDRCNVLGYTAWTLMDNFEWSDGYTLRFGLFHVDFEDDKRPRVAKMAAIAYRRIIENRTVPKEYLRVSSIRSEESRNYLDV